MTLLDGRVAVITGAGTGLGRSYAHLLAREGASIVVNDYAAEPANTVAAEIRAAGGKAVAVVADVGAVSSGAMILDAALDAFKQVDILVNNAGILRDKSLLKMQEEDWDAVVRVHL
jgi:NAD(P)-dependent dehydrogenase (short-subunit alcohol dehydrogenase family)